MATSSIVKGVLTVSGTRLFSGVADGVTLEKQAVGDEGVFLRAGQSGSTSRWVVSLGKPAGLERFTCCHRYEPFWMKPAAGTAISQVPAETQVLVLELGGGRVALLVPLIDSPFRASLQAKGDELALVVESGDALTPGSSALSLFIAVGADPYEVIARSAPAVSARLGRGRLRVDKPLPAFSDAFGWCTWDAFYQEVSHAKVREGLASFEKIGVVPRLLILDDGWQTERTMPTGERRLTGFPANAKFPGDLAPTVRMAKDEFGIETFLVWHAVHGYWGGVDGAALPGYEVREQPRSYGQGILSHGAHMNVDWWGPLVGLVPPAAIHRFYHDYHRHLRAQGVDGVKVDNQAATEGLGFALGGRVALMHAYREALEGSVNVHFDGNLINCMSCANEMFYSAASSTLTRTSTDFWPNLPASHGGHLYTNAQVSAWFGEFTHPDWDMFQSGHPMGAYHAAGRAVSGCPVYVSDKPGSHDAALLRKLVLSDGTVLRALDIGRPTLDCFFHDPTREDVLLKIFNRNLESGVVAAFNARYHADEKERKAIAGSVSPSDVPGLEGDRFAVYAHHARSLAVIRADASLPVTLPELAAEVFTFVPIDGEIAAIGLADKFNSAGAIIAKRWDGQDYTITLRDGGSFVAWCKREPTSVLVDGKQQKFAYDPATGLRVELKKKGEQSLRLRF